MHATITLNTFKLRIRIKLGMLHICSPLGCDPLSLVDGFTPVEDNIGLLETKFDKEEVFVFVFPEDVMGSVNLTLLSLFFGVTATNFSPELLILGQVLLIPVVTRDSNVYRLYDVSLACLSAVMCSAPNLHMSASPRVARCWDCLYLPLSAACASDVQQRVFSMVDESGFGASDV
ncbi:hypothetical protein Tco_0906813 [Tanacetum coccineum]|uniref:Uncharacterized protein n=1 Tax=Tanacetum coccineum TaxID=301880 RepID=A0ABQ5CJV6_9ASTR